MKDFECEEEEEKRRAPVQVDIPVEDVDCDVAQGENHSGKENDLVIKDISVFWNYNRQSLYFIVILVGIGLQREILWVENVRSAKFVAQGKSRK